MRYIVLVAVLAGAGWYVVANYERLSAQAVITPGAVVLLVALNMVTVWFESLRFAIEVRKLGYRLSVGSGWKIFTVMQAVNHLAPKVGTFSGGYYVSRRYGVSFHDYVAIAIPYIFIQMLAAGTLGLVTVVGTILTGGISTPATTLLFVMLVSVPVIFFLLARSHIPLGRLPRLLQRFVTAIKEMYGDHGFVGRLVAVDLGYFLACTLRFMVASTMFSRAVSLLEGMTVLAVGNFLRVMSIVPGGLGIAEIASGWTVGLMGGDAFIAGVAAGFDRIVYVALIIVFGGVGFFTLSGRSEFHRPPPDSAEARES
jgi:uncharacterized membrane protein YbhN (UPF0104 family)